MQLVCHSLLHDVILSVSHVISMSEEYHKRRSLEWCRWVQRGGALAAAAASGPPGAAVAVGK